MPIAWKGLTPPQDAIGKIEGEVVSTPFGTREAYTVTEEKIQPAGARQVQHTWGGSRARRKVKGSRLDRYYLGHKLPEAGITGGI